MTREEKHREIEDFVSQRTCPATILIVVQHFCFETWALANRKIIRPKTDSPRLRAYQAFFDVSARDPELLPPYPQEDLTRSQFAEKYLRAGLNDKYTGLTYTKRNPQPMKHPKYFLQVRARHADTAHIPSFADFLAAFV
jgi:hypothetical protein